MWPLTRRKPANRWVVFLLCIGLPICLSGLLALAVPTLRHSVLLGLGGMLVVSDPLEQADIIVIATDADGAGVLEAADLVQQGIATRVALFADPPDAIDREFLRRGVPYFNAAAVSLQQLRTLGVTAIEQIPRGVAGTEDEGVVLPAWCREHHFHTVIFIATTDHSRRARRVLNRSRDYPTRVIVRYSHYSDFDPDTWWRTRGGIRTQIVESQKLLLDILRHPLS